MITLNIFSYVVSSDKKLNCLLGLQDQKLLDATWISSDLIYYLQIVP